MALDSSKVRWARSVVLLGCLSATPQLIALAGVQSAGLHPALWARLWCWCWCTPPLLLLWVKPPSPMSGGPKIGDHMILAVT